MIFSKETAKAEDRDQHSREIRHALARQRTLANEPKSAKAFIKWAQRFPGITPSRAQELLALAGYTTPVATPENKDKACRIIQVADKLGIFPGVKVPTKPITREKLSDIIRALCAVAKQQIESARHAALAATVAAADRGRLIETAGVDDDSHLSPSKLANLFAVPLPALRSRLNRWRSKNLSGWIENADRTSTDALYLYRVGSIRNILQSLKTNGNRTP